MASPLKAGKQPVQLAAGGVRVSKIRRDPPAKVKEIPVRDRDEVDRRNAAIGVIAFAIAIVIAILGLSSYGGWSPRQVVIHIDRY